MKGEKDQDTEKISKSLPFTANRKATNFIFIPFSDREFLYCCACAKMATLWSDLYDLDVFDVFFFFFFRFFYYCFSLFSLPGNRICHGLPHEEASHFQLDIIIRTPSLYRQLCAWTTYYDWPPLSSNIKKPPSWNS